MRLEIRTSASWLVSVLLPLVVACGPIDPTDSLLALHEPQDGFITFYDADGTGHCLYDASPQDMDVAAINIGQFLESAVCGSCVEIEGPKGTLRVRIVDSCADCYLRGHLDLSEQAFAKLADPEEGRVRVSWRMVSCDNVVGPLRYRFKEGSQENWVGLQVFNHRLPVTKLDYWKDDAWVPVKRESYNYFVAPRGMGSGPIKVRVTAVDGQTLEDTFPGPESDNSRIFEGAAQFPAN